MAYADRYSGWVSTFHMKEGTTVELMKVLRMLFSVFGVPDEVSTDGGPQYKAYALEEFFKQWGVSHRVSAAYNPSSNGRAEAAVKTVKRLIRENTGRNGTLNTDGMVKALLQHRNTPAHGTDQSPAQVLYGRQLRDSLPTPAQLRKVRPEWLDMLDRQEKAMAKKHAEQVERLSEHARELPELQVGQQVAIQNQFGPKPTHWDKTGHVVERLDFHQYRIKVDGSGRTTLRNRQHLRKIRPFDTWDDDQHGVKRRQVDRDVEVEVEPAQEQPAPTSMEQEGEEGGQDRPGSDWASEVEAEERRQANRMTADPPAPPHQEPPTVQRARPRKRPGEEPRRGGRMRKAPRRLSPCKGKSYE